MTTILRLSSLMMIFCVFSPDKTLQGQSFSWVKQMGSVADTDESILVKDPDGNLLTAGIFEGYADFDHSDSDLEFNAGSSKDIFITKTSPNGDFIWAKQIRSTTNYDNLYLGDIICDNLGQFYITGNYFSIVDFDPNPDIEFLVDEVDPSNDDRDVFIAKYSPEGNLIWVKTIGSYNTELGTTLDITSSGNIIVTGEFQYTVDFNPGPEVANLSTSNNGIFILTLTENGDYVDAKYISGTSNAFNVYHSTMDANDNLYLVGGFYGTADFDPGAANYSVTAAGSGATRFICKLDQTLSCSWVKTLIATGSSAVIRDIQIDDDQSIIIVGSFWGTIDMDPSDETTFNLTSAGYSDAYVAKLDETGALVWADQFGGTDSDEALAFDFMDNGHIMAGLNIRSASADIDPGAGTQTITNGGSYDLVLVELNNDGTYENMVHLTGAQLQQVNDIVATPDAIYTSGTFAGTTDFDPGTGVTSIYPDESWDYFVLKLSLIPSMILDANPFYASQIYPNPTQGLVNISLDQIEGLKYVELYDSNGKLLYAFTTNNAQLKIDLSDIPQGVYRIQMRNESGHSVSKQVIKT